MLSATLRAGRSEVLDRREGPRAAAREDDGARRALAAHKTVASAALQKSDDDVAPVTYALPSESTVIEGPRNTPESAPTSTPWPPRYVE